MKRYTAPKLTFWKCNFCETILEFDDLDTRIPSDRFVSQKFSDVDLFYLSELCYCISGEVKGRYYLMSRADIVEYLGREVLQYQVSNS